MNSNQVKLVLIISIFIIPFFISFMLLDDYTEDKEWVTTNYGKLIKPVLPINNEVVKTRSNISNTTEFNGNGRFETSGSMWTPWSGQGNPKLEISTGKVQLMVDTKNGTREDALPFMDSTVADWKLISTFTYDCLAGFNLLIGNQNGGGGPSGINAKLTVEAYVGPCDTAGSFNLQDDNNKITVGSCTCNGTKDGFLVLSVEDNSYDYTITVSGLDNPITIKGANKTATVPGLGKGKYTICFKVDGQSNYEQCFEATITEPNGI